MAAINADLIYSYIAKIDEKADLEAGTNLMSITQGHRALLYGLILGATVYLAGLALELRAETIL